MGLVSSSTETLALCLSFRIFSPFTFKVIIGRYVLIAIVNCFLAVLVIRFSVFLELV